MKELLIILIQTVNASLGWNSYSYRYLSAIIEVNSDDSSTWSTLEGHGAYGYRSSFDRVEGKLVRPDNFNGCGDELNVLLEPSLHAEYDTPDEDWIALIARGDCLFEEKIRIANDAGAVGVIIYNIQEGEPVVPMEYENENPDLVSIMISYETYQELMFYNTSNGTFARIQPGKLQVNNSFERIVIATISISFLILLALSIGWVVVYYVQRFRLIHRRYQEQKRRQDLAERALKMLKQRKLKTTDALVKDEETCAVCIDEYKSNDQVTELPCHHSFHKKCIEPWVLDKGTCPMCKVNVFQALGIDNPHAQNNTNEEPAAQVWTADEVNVQMTNQNGRPNRTERSEDIVFENQNFNGENEDSNSVSSASHHTSHASVSPSGNQNITVRVNEAYEN